MSWARRTRRPCHVAYAGEDELEAFVEREFKPGGDPTIIKAHAIGLRALARLRAGQARAVCTVRDPRDCVASDLKFMDWPFDAVARRVSSNLAYLAYYRASRHTLFVRYEQMMENPLKQVTRIAGHLGIDLPPAELARIDVATGFESSRKVCEDVRRRPIHQTLQSGTHRVDPVTHLHENHIGTAKVGRWKDDLSAEQGEHLTELFHPWLVELGYDVELSRAEAYA